MQNISYNYSNAFLGLGSGSIYLIIYFLIIILICLIKFFILITKGKFGGQNLIKKLIKGLFFNAIISMTMEGYFEFLVFGIINAYTADLNSIGDILGITTAGFCLLMAIIAIPIALLWNIFTKDEKNLAS